MRTLGSGLGLFISRKMVELHHGRIEAWSEPGQGARFTVTLPHVVAAGALPDLSGLTDSRVLVLSASKSNALLLEGVLIEAGLIHVSKDWSVDPHAPSSLPHIVVADAQAPHVERIGQVARAIKEQGAAPVWLVVGSAAEVAAVARLVDGAHERLDAPVNPLAYLQRVEALLSRAGAAAATSGAMAPRAARS